jgi:hypothetical protein
MSTAKRYLTAAAAILLWANIVCAQEERPASSTSSRITVTASASADRLRFTAPSTVVQVRLEVYDANGVKLFDNEIRGGNVIDWRLQDGHAEPLSDGAYLCVVTVKSLSGRITQRVASATVDKRAAMLQPYVASQLTPQQSASVGPIEEDASLVLLKEDEHQTTTVISHNGEDGQITRGRGALSFRIGDFFRGKEIEQMRLTAEGSLGIGVANPQAKLDVAGTIRASQGIIFPDGSIQFSAARKTLGAASVRSAQPQVELAEGEEPHPAIAGSGTTGRLPKWQDGPAGVLNDSVISELNGSIGINGAPNPIFKLDVNGHNRFRGSNVSFYLTGVKPGGNEWLFQTVDADGRLRIFDSTSGAERFSLTQGGNVGIGTSSPTTATGGRGLHIEGSVSALRLGATIGNGQQWEWQSTVLDSIGAMNLSNLSNFSNPLTVLANGRVGIGTGTPGAKLDIFGNSGHVLIGDPGCNPGFGAIGFGTSMTGCSNYSLLGEGSHTYLNRPSGGSILFREGNVTQMSITPGGNVGIGTSSPAQRLSVAGTVQSTSGGFMFPDGSVQTAAAITGTAASAGSNSTDTPVPIVIGGISVFSHVNVPPGHYLAVATVEVVNSANFLGQNNTRNVICSVSGGQDFSFDVSGPSRSTVSFHSLSNVVETGASIKCRANVTGGELQITTRRLTVVKLDGSVSLQ